MSHSTPMNPVEVFERTGEPTMCLRTASNVTHEPSRTDAIAFIKTLDAEDLLSAIANVGRADDRLTRCRDRIAKVIHLPGLATSDHDKSVLIGHLLGTLQVVHAEVCQALGDIVGVAGECEAYREFLADRR